MGSFSHGWTTALRAKHGASISARTSAGAIRCTVALLGSTYSLFATTGPSHYSIWVAISVTIWVIGCLRQQITAKRVEFQLLLWDCEANQCDGIHAKESCGEGCSCTS